MSVSTLKILIVVTSHASLGTTGKPTGYYLSEVSHPFAALAAQGIAVDIASPAGGEAPLDPKSLDLKDPLNKAFWDNAAHRDLLRHTKKLADVQPTEYAGVLFAGGHGTMWDFPADAAVTRLIRDLAARHGVIAAVCHGVAALTEATLADGTYFVNGRRLGGFSDAEEAAAGLTAVMPFLLESRLRERGALYSSAPLWQEHVVVDGRLVTGQNPASALGVGAAVAGLLVAKP